MALTKLDELIINIQCAKNVVEKAGAAEFMPEKRIVEYLDYALNCAKEIAEEKKLQSAMPTNTGSHEIASSCVSCLKMVFCSKSINYQSDACKQLRVSA